MKKEIIAVATVVTMFLPFAASAHEHGTYQIGKNYYQIVVGSLNEPIAVDDKTGLDLMVYKCRTALCMASMGPDGDMDGPVGPAVEGLEKTLKLEIRADNQNRQLGIKPQWGKPGAYTAAFYPTLATTYTYALSGSIDGTPVDLVYQCLPEGGKAADESEAKKLSDNVTQLTLAGGFGCPMPKEGMGFPASSASIHSVAQIASGAESTGVVGIVLGIASLALAGYALARKSS